MTISTETKTVHKKLSNCFFQILKVTLYEIVFKNIKKPKVKNTQSLQILKI